jgi:hypothetical protein
MAFAIDLASLTLLFALPPSGGWAKISRYLFREQLVSFTRLGVPGISVLLGVSATVTVLGTRSSLFSTLRGEPIALVEDASPLKGDPGEERYVPVTLVNHGRRPVKIFGGTHECNVRATRDLPLTIPPGEMRTPVVMVYFIRTPGVVYRNGLFYTDSPSQPEVRFSFTLRTLDKAE